MAPDPGSQRETQQQRLFLIIMIRSFICEGCCAQKDRGKRGRNVYTRLSFEKFRAEKGASSTHTDAGINDTQYSEITKCIQNSKAKAHAIDYKYMCFKQEAVLLRVPSPTIPLEITVSIFHQESHH